MPSSFARRTARKPHRVIDACILIASLAERDESCARYLSGLGYQHHGHITHPLIGEVVNGSCRHVRDLFLRRKVFEYLEEMLVRNRISVLPYKTIRPEQSAAGPSSSHRR
ncbi:hypothetical protein J4439_03435 [Candidatus Woesearchaeota archaeon]|nr:hypothetical protein [Candidatus Woesearchaeota archaeon]